MIIILYIILALFLLFLFIPKGTNLHEFLHIPLFWWGNLLVKKDNIISEKIKFGNHWQQYFRIYFPKKNKAEKKYIILYFHGGGWVAGSPKMLTAAAQLFANESYITVLSSYRKAPLASYSEMRKDVTLCLQKLVSYLNSTESSDKKIIIGGMSAGATLAALLTFEHDELLKIGFDPNRIAGLFLCGPPIDISVMPWSLPLYFYAGLKGSQKFQQANPVNHFLKNITCPILLIHGKKDGLVNYKSSTSFIEKNNLQNSNQVELFTMENGTHMDSANWSYKNNELRKVILEWLDKIEKK